MTNITQLTETVYAVKVPEGAVVVTISNVHGLIKWKEKEYAHRPYWDTKLLPEAIWWSFLFLSSQVTEERAAEIVSEKQDGLYLNYVKTGIFTRYWQLDTAIQSFQSLLRSKSLEGEYAIIEKIK